MPNNFQVPSGTAKVSVSLIDTTSRLTQFPIKALMEPAMPGLEGLDLPAWSFLIEHPSGRKLLFDIGVPYDWEDMAPAVSGRIKQYGWDVKVERKLVDILKEGGIDLPEIEAIIWSHWHWDHIGNPDHFPTSTSVIVGPGFKKDRLPAYPTNKNATVRESDFAGRELKEISHEQMPLQIGQFKAHDYFGDGSCYLLDTPGHAIGHLAGLARVTTNPDTFIVMAGDLNHHAAEMRPNTHLPLPESIPLDATGSLGQRLHLSAPCPGHMFDPLYTSRNMAKGEPFFNCNIGEDKALAIETIKGAMPIDADEDVLYIFAHDAKVRGVVKMWPEGSLNDWKKEGWREKLIWRFLEDFAEPLKRIKEGGGKL